MNEPALQRDDPYSEALPRGATLLGDQFTITDRIGAGGFGITYRAQDNVLGRTVVTSWVCTVRLRKTKPLTWRLT